MSNLTNVCETNLRSNPGFTLVFVCLKSYITLIVCLYSRVTHAVTTRTSVVSTFANISMSEASDGPSPSPSSATQNDNHRRGGNRNGRNGRRNNRGGEVQRPASAIEELKQNFFYEGTKQHPTFMEVAKNILLYAATNFKNAGDYRHAIDSSPRFQLPEIIYPEDPGVGATRSQERRFDRDYDQAHKNEMSRMENNKRLFALILMQMTSSLQHSIQGRTEYSELSKNDDAMGLLKLVQKVIATNNSNQQPAFARITAEEQLWNVRQGRNEALERFLQRLNNAFDNVEQYGGSLGVNEAAIEEELGRMNVSPSTNATTEQRVRAKTNAKERYKAIVYIKKLSERHNALRDWLHNSFTAGDDRYPSTLSSAITLANEFNNRANRQTTLSNNELRRMAEFAMVNDGQEMDEPAGTQQRRNYGNSQRPWN